MWAPPTPARDYRPWTLYRIAADSLCAQRRRSGAREIGVSQFYWTLSDNLKAKML